MSEKKMFTNKSPKIGKFGLIDTWFSKIFSKPALLTLVGIGTVLFIITAWNRYVYIDDAFFGEQSYWFAKDGIVKTPSLLDFLGCDKHLFSYHKLNILVGALLIKIFGWGITPLRIITLFFLAGLIFYVIKYFKSEETIYTKHHQVIALFFLLFTPQVYLLGYTFRPEIWVTFFGFASYYYLTRQFKENTNKYAILSGIFAGLAFLTHLNGLIFPVAGFMVFLLQKKYRPLILFSVTSLIVCLLYFWDLWQDNNFSTWLYQVKNWPDNNSPNYFKHDFWSLVKSILVKLSEEHKRFFWGYKVWAISGFFVLSFAWNFKYFYKQQRVLFIYLVTLIITQNVAGSQIAERYLLYYYPFFAIIIAYELVKLLHEKALIRKTLYILMLVIQIYAVTKIFTYINKENRYTIDYYDSTFAKIPATQERILVPYEMFFNSLNKYNLVSYKGFEYFEIKNNLRLTQEEFFRRATSLGVKYIIIPERVIDNTDGSVQCIQGGKIGKNKYYKEFYRDSRTIILEKI